MNGNVVIAPHPPVVRDREIQKCRAVGERRHDGVEPKSTETWLKVSHTKCIPIVSAAQGAHLCFDSIFSMRFDFVSLVYLSKRFLSRSNWYYRILIRKILNNWQLSWNSSNKGRWCHSIFPISLKLHGSKIYQLEEILFVHYRE